MKPKVGVSDLLTRDHITSKQQRQNLNNGFQTTFLFHWYRQLPVYNHHQKQGHTYRIQFNKALLNFSGTDTVVDHRGRTKHLLPTLLKLPIF